MFDSDKFDRDFNFMHRIFWVMFFVVAGIILLGIVAKIVLVVFVASKVDFNGLIQGVNHLIQKLNSL